MNTAVVAPPLPDAPYRGIQPFRFVDQQIFAARDDETWTLLSNVTLYRAVLLYGDSGTGKSSLVNAGLLPQALKENYVPDRLRVQPFAGREIKIERIRMSGREEQAAYLPSNFAPEESEASAESIELSLADFRARLEEFRPAPDNADSDAASGALFLAPRTTPRPLLIFDQFEEFITLFEEAQRVGTTEETRRALEQVPAAQRDILAVLVELIQDESLPIKILFSFREDYLAKLSVLFDYCPELLDQAQRLLPPSIEALPQIIRAPFIDPALRAHFLKQGGEAGSELSEPLAQKIANQLGRRSEGDTANLTELQIVCQRLWQARDPEKLFAQDGIEGLLKDYGADVFLNFSPEQRDAAVVLLSHMITASNTRNIISEEDLLSRTVECDFGPSQCSEALKALSRSQIVRREPRHSIYFYEITSEYLVPWIKESVAERKSAEERRLAEEAQQKLEAQRAQAVAKFEAEKRRGRMMKRLLAGMILLLIIAVGLGVFAYQQFKRADAAEEAIRDTQIRQQGEVINAITLASSENKEESLQGVSQMDTLIKENKISTELKSVLISTASTNQDQQVRQAAYNVLTQAAQNDQKLTQSIVKAAETSDTLAKRLPPRFYIHLTDDSQRGQAQQVASALKRQGYVVPGIRKAGNNAKINQLRYFRRNEPGMPKPDEIVPLLKNTTRSNWRAIYLEGHENSTSFRPGHFEIWFAGVDAQQDGSKPSTGTLLLFLVDAEDGKPLRGMNPRLTLRNLKNKDEFERRDTNLTLEEGSYDVFVKLEGYKQTYRDHFSITAGQKTPLTLKLTREKGRSTPEQGLPRTYDPKKPGEQTR